MITRVKYQDVEHLDQLQLTELLRRLLHLQVKIHGLLHSSVSVALNITVTDGGEDGRVQWNGGPDSADYIPNRFSVFQSKASALDPADCAKEIVRRGEEALKPRVHAVLDASGSYIFFVGHGYTGELIEKRIRKVRGKLAELGRTDSDTADIRFYDANKISDWVNLFPSAVNFVRECNGRTCLAAAQTWIQWSHYASNQIAYASIRPLEERITEIRTRLEEPREVVRLVGLAGMGKSRLALEVFRPSVDEENPSIAALSASVIYIDFSRTDRSAICGYVAELANEGNVGTLVVDNCPGALHEQIADEVRKTQSRLSVLTIDDRPEERSSQSHYIRLSLTDLYPAIRQMLQNAYPALDQRDIERIAEFAEGFPQMAVLLGESRLRGSEQVGGLTDDHLTSRLIHLNEGDVNRNRNVIRILSLFDHVEYGGRATEELRFLASLARVNVDEFIPIIERYIGRGILQRRGRFVRVAPRPLAVSLATSWWNEEGLNKLEKILQGAVEHKLVEALSRQLRFLDQLPRAHELAEQALEPGGPLGSAEVLGSASGARYLRGLVEMPRK